MPFEERDGCEYKYNWLDEETVHIGHFLVTGDFGEGTGSETLQYLVDRFADEGATQIIINMGGGEESEEFLRSFAANRPAISLRVRSINRDGHVNAVLSLQERSDEE